MISAHRSSVRLGLFGQQRDVDRVEFDAKVLALDCDGGGDVGDQGLEDTELGLGRFQDECPGFGIEPVETHHLVQASQRRQRIAEFMDDHRGEVGLQFGEVEEAFELVTLLSDETIDLAGRSRPSRVDQVHQGQDRGEQRQVDKIDR